MPQWKNLVLPPLKHFLVGKIVHALKGQYQYFASSSVITDITTLVIMVPVIILMAVEAAMVMTAFTMISHKVILFYLLFYASVLYALNSLLNWVDIQVYQG